MPGDLVGARRRRLRLRPRAVGAACLDGMRVRVPRMALPRPSSRETSAGPLGTRALSGCSRGPVVPRFTRRLMPRRRGAGGRLKPWTPAWAWEDWRVTSRLLSTLIVASLALGLAGCGDAFNAGPLTYVENERLTADLKDAPSSRTRSATGWRRSTGRPPGHPCPRGLGPPLRRHLPGELRRDRGRRGRSIEADRRTSVSTPRASRPTVRQAGGYSLYRLHCLHCHGVSGAGDGPTAPFLYPRPRDYRKGLFKFTSTPTGVKPTRADLRKTIGYGLHGTSMPAFESLMSAGEIEQVIDYVIFLSMRGETEIGLDRRGRDRRRERRPGPGQRHRPGDRQGRLQQVEGRREPGGQSADPAAPGDPREHPPRPRPVPLAEHDRATRSTAPRATARRPWATGRAWSPRRSSTTSSSAATRAT